MKKFLLSLVLMAFAATTMTAQTATQPVAQVKKECCKDKKMDGKKCDKPADQQCPDCKQANAQKQECKKAAGQKCDKAAMKHECKDHKDGQPCTKPADQQCPDCKQAAKKN